MIKQGIECDRFLNIIAHQRSGHHGVMHWLFCQLPQPSAFMRHKGGSLAWFNDGEFPAAPQSRPKVLGLNLEGSMDLLYKVEKDEPKLIIVRDVKNLMVSLAKLRGPARLHKQFFQSMQHYLSFALDDVIQKQSNAIVVNYYEWHKSREYRKKLFSRICTLIGVEAEFTDAGKNFVMGAGGGSSFTKRTLSADKMDVLNRYKAKEFQSLFKLIPGRVLTYNNMYFGDIYD